LIRKKPKIFWNNLSIAVKLFMSSFLSAVVSLTVLLSLWVPQERSRIEAEVVNQSENYLRTISETIVPYLIQNQIATVFETLDRVSSRHKDWAFVELYKGNKKIYPLFEGPVEHNYITLKETLNTETISGDYLVVGIDESVVSEAVESLSTVIIVFAVVFVFLVSVVTLLMSYRSIILPIRNLKDQISMRTNQITEAAGVKQPVVKRSKVIVDEVKSLKVNYSILMKLIEKSYAELESVRDEAVSANNQKSIFLANMSHEIRSPLNIIAGLSEMLLDGNLSEEDRSSLEKIITAGHHLGALVNDVLDISKIESGFLELDIKSHSIDELISELIAFNEVEAKKKRVNIVVDYSGHFDNLLMIDSLRVKQIVQNLLNNAIKFCFMHSDILLNVTYDQKLLTIEVVNSGPEILLENQSRIFEKFTQEFKETGAKYGGTGLGLALSKNLANLMGGDLVLESGFSSGAKFIFTAPVEESGEKPKETVMLNTAYSEKVDIRRVLIVDDEALNIKILRAMIGRYGFEVEEALCGVEALSLVELNDYDLIFMDMRLPDIMGDEVTKRIRSVLKTMNGRKQPLIAAITANAFKEDRETMLTAGCNTFMSKPIKKEEVLRYIDAIMLPGDKPKAS
jgi:signal transduction histidine kinase/CheY-like chemotaxis protein